MKRVMHVMLAMAVSVAFLVSGCGQKKDQEGTQGGQKKLKLAFLTINADNYWTIARRGCEKAEEDLRTFVFDFRIPSEATASEQKRVLDDLLARGVDGVAISPVDPANQTEMLNEAAAQTLLFTIDSDAPESKRACYLGTDNVAAGRQAGEMIKEAIPEGGKIMLFVGGLEPLNARQRLEGITKTIAGGNITVAGVRTDGGDAIRAKDNALDALTKYPDVACLVGLFGYNGPAIRSAVKSRDKVGEVKIVCFDENEETLAGVKSGEIHATIVQQPFEFGYQGMKLMIDYLNGDQSAIPENKQIIVPTKAVKKENVDAFKAELANVLGK